MRLNLKATNISLNDDIRSYLERRLSNLGKLIDVEDPAVLIDVELGRSTKHHQSGDIFFAEINIHRGKEAFRAVSNRPDLKSAIDDMLVSVFIDPSFGRVIFIEGQVKG